MSKTVQGETRFWLIRAIGLLLLLQALVLVGTIVYKLSLVNWQPEFIGLLNLREAQEASVVLVTFVPAGVMALVAGIGLFFLLRIGWLLAIVTQGLSLFGCLWLYFWWRPSLIYPAIMLFCIVMVLYLNSYDVRVAFRGSRVSPGQEAPYEL